jgi:hypothetical protein
MENNIHTLQVAGSEPLSKLFDTDIDNYSTAELFSILGIDDSEPGFDEIKDTTDNYYKKYLSKDRKVANFFMAIQNRLLTYIAELDIASQQYSGDAGDLPTPSELNEGVGFNDEQEEYMQNSMDQLQKGLITNLHEQETGSEELEAYEAKLRKEQSSGGLSVIQNFVQSSDLNSWLNTQSSTTPTLPGTADIKSPGVKTRNASAQQKTMKVIDADVKQGRLNPDMKNTIQRLVNIDSSYRTPLQINNTGTDDYQFTLTEPMTSVLSMTLYSIELPYSWYTFTEDKGMTGLKLTTITSTGDQFPPGGGGGGPGKKIAEGNYTGLGLLKAVEDVLNNFITEMITASGGVEDLGTGPWFTLSQNPNTGRTQIHALPCTGAGCTDGYYPYVLQILWFDVSFSTHTLINAQINDNLGWALGYRSPFTTLYPIEPGATTTQPCPPSPSIVNTSGTKYIIIKLDDYKTNRVNHGLVGIDSSEQTNTKVPSYLNADTQRSRFTMNADTVAVVASAPRLLTAKQLFTINAITSTNALSTVRYRGSSPDEADIFAKLPVRRNISWNTYNTTTSTTTVVDDAPAAPIVDFSGPLQNNIREYFGPVDIRSMKVTLYDDKGHILGLNGHDWSFSLILKCLYQY